jgi:hypothetical protein
MIGRLIRATSDPRGRTSNRAHERLDFAHFAACEPRFERPMKARHTIALNKRFHAHPVGDEPADLPSVATFGLHPNFQRLPKEASGIKRDDIDIESLGEDRVSDRLIFDAKARREHNTATDFSTRTYEPITQIAPLGSLR